MNVGENIRRIRKEKGLTQKQLAKILNVSEPMISQYEAKESLKLDTVKKIAKGLNVPYTDLLDYIIKAVAITDEEYNEYLILKEKDTPKKPAFDKTWEDEETKDIYNEDGSINENICKCPNCHKRSIYDFEYGVRFNHCHECGQAIDWSNEE